MTDFAGVLRTLIDGRVAFILVGGVAATVHGSARLTRDVSLTMSGAPVPAKPSLIAAISTS